MSRHPRVPDPGFDPRIADWLEADANRAPDGVLETVLAAFPSIPQRRAWRVPWRPIRMNRFILAGAVAATVVAVALGGSMLFSSKPPTVGPAPSPTVSPTPSPPSPSVTSAAAADYSNLKGTILMEHLGNAPDGSEMPTTNYHTERRRLYFMNPATMTGATAREFLPGQPATGKLAADVSRDQTKVVFQDAGDGTGEYIWTAHLDGTGLTRIETTCNRARAACGDWDPAFDPTGTKVVFVRAQADTTILKIKDLMTGDERGLLSTEGPSNKDVPEQPAWSPDGKKIAFGRVHWNADGLPGSATIWIVDIATDKTTKLPIALSLPGDPHWSPDGSRILLTNGPVSVAGVAFDDRPGTGDVYTVAPDGSDLRRLTQSGGTITADWTPDGHILFFNNYFWLMNGDGTHALPVNDRGDDLSELGVGFGYVGHWIPAP